jgi:hypothetical protein
MADELLEKETIVLEDIERILDELRPGQYERMVESEVKSFKKTRAAKPKTRAAKPVSAEAITKESVPVDAASSVSAGQEEEKG